MCINSIKGENKLNNNITQLADFSPSGLEDLLVSTTLCILYSIYDEKDKIDPRVSHCKLQSTNSEAKDVFEKCLKGQKFPKNYSPEYYTLASHLRPHTLPKIIDFPR